MDSTASLASSSGNMNATNDGPPPETIEIPRTSSSACSHPEEKARKDPPILEIIQSTYSNSGKNVARKEQATIGKEDEDKVPASVIPKVDQVNDMDAMNKDQMSAIDAMNKRDLADEMNQLAMALKDDSEISFGLHEHLNDSPVRDEMRRAGSNFHDSCGSGLSVISRPGAFPVAGIGVTDAADEDGPGPGMDDTYNSYNRFFRTEDSLPPVQQALAVAKIVEDHSSRPLDLPRAVPESCTDSSSSSAEAPLSTRNRKGKQNGTRTKTGRHLCLVAGIVLLVLSGVILLLTLVITSSPQSSSGARYSPEDASPFDIDYEDSPVDDSNTTTLPIPADLATNTSETWILNAFQNETETLVALQVTGSPQYQALQWVLADPQLDAFPEWRLRQRFALATLYYATDGPNWINNDKWLSYAHHECDWFTKDYFAPPNQPAFSRLSLENPCGSVLRDNNQTAVTPVPSPSLDRDAGSGGVYKHIWLFVNGLKGEIPQELFWLTSLQDLMIFKNELEGTLSSHIGKLSDLKRFTASFNSIRGTIPSEIGKLTSSLLLAVAGNKLTGTLPSELFQVQSVRNLMLDHNRLHGSIPSQIGALSNSVLLGLQNNEFTGTLPSEIGHLNRFTRELRLESNYLSGSVSHLN